MNDEELRALVRTAIARTTGAKPDQHPHPRPAAVGVHLHASHGTFVLPVGADAEGPCLIEPSVLCNHCGYCQSYGH